jgi:fructose-bisphosphate aldolase class II
MALVTLKDVLGKAMSADYGVPSFNVHNLEFVRGVMRAAEELRAPVILAIAPVSIEHAGLEALAALARVHAQRAPVPVVVHLDHGRDIDVVRRSIELGLSSVMYDGSDLPFDENIRRTRAVVEVAHRTGVSVEGEIGTVAKHEDVASGAVTAEQLRQYFTRPEEARRFVEETGVDALAVAVGTVHRMPLQSARIDRGRLREIHEAVSVPLVFHGCTGMVDEEYRAAYGSGVKKFNIGTRLVKAFEQGLQAEQAAGKGLLPLLKAGANAVYESAKNRIGTLNCAGRA